MQMPKIPWGVIALLSATVWFTAQPSTHASASDQCQAAPGAAAPRGMHWYYRIDRANNRHCWYLDAAGLQVHSHTADVAPPPPPAQPAADAALPQAPEPPAPLQREADAGTDSPPVAAAAPTASEFAVRWPNLPMALNLAAFKLTEMSNGYAATRLVADVEPQMPSRWPILEAETETAEPQQPQQPADTTSFAPPLLSLALSLAALLFAGWGIGLGVSAYRSAERLP